MQTLTQTNGLATQTPQAPSRMRLVVFAMRARSGARFELKAHQLTYVSGRICRPGMYEMSCAEGVKVYVSGNDDRIVRVLAEEGL